MTTLNLQQQKLSKSEWDSIELPVSDDEKEILHLIMNGYHNVNIKYNKSSSLITFLKMTFSREMENYLFVQYFSERITNLFLKYNYTLSINPISTKSNTKINKADLIRLGLNNHTSISQNKWIYENALFTLIEICLEMKSREKKEWMKYYYTLHQLIQSQKKIETGIKHLNHPFIEICESFLKQELNNVELNHIIQNALTYIEQNDYLLQYSDITLYPHQKQIFTEFKQVKEKESSSNLVLYISSTGTGKTLSPLGLSQDFKIIFVCAARHVGLALARSAIQCRKKIAFAFGCDTVDDIRLHYFAAKEGIRNFKTGGFYKVDNSVGDNVEIMICDIKSYLSAMHYMIAFNEPETIITYWDEPTITMDYLEHDFHKIIHKNWKENKIPNMVLSSATLPKIHELNETIADFKDKFHESNIIEIIHHECQKTIPIINSHGYAVLPHLLTDNYTVLQEIVEHCEEYKSILRYFDVKTIVHFICYLEHEKLIPDVLISSEYFQSIEQINIVNLKLYYLKVLRNLNLTGASNWSHIFDECMKIREKRIQENETVDTKGNKIVKSVSLNSYNNPNNNKLGQPLTRTLSMPTPTPTLSSDKLGTSGVFITTKDAYTLTFGPTMYLTNDVDKIAKFCIQQANIPNIVMEDILNKINFNNTLKSKIIDLEKSIEDLMEKNEKTQTVVENGEIKNKKKNKTMNDMENNKTVQSKIIELDSLKSMIKVTKLNDVFVPNSCVHLNKWTRNEQDQNQNQNQNQNKATSFTSNIDEETVVKIMMLNNVADSWKVLLLMGIGVFCHHESIEYTEIMKNLADHQKLYLVISSSDYIYGTNNQACHGYLSKDLCLTQEKIIQAMGRIGRNRLNQEYSVRFRNDAQLMTLFLANAEKPEVINMNRLFCS